MASRKEIKTLLYVGGDQQLINSLQESGLFIVEHKENSILASEWMAKGHPFDAIVCEMNLPGLNGLDFYRMMAAENGKPEQAFILVDQKQDDVRRLKAMKAGIEDLYVKPVDPVELHTRLGYIAMYPVSITKKDALPSGTPPAYRMPAIKRAFDIVSSGLGLLLLSPFFLLIALLIRLESKGKVFYAAKRVGTGYRIFSFYKFRSMYTGADLQLKSLASQNQYAAAMAEAETKTTGKACPECEKQEGYCSTPLHIEGEIVCERRYLKEKELRNKAAFVKILNDPRVTRVGRFIRKTSIDELPQLFNVLKGDMSVVGNRPLPLYEAELLTSDQWGERFLGPAGITGLWQVNKRGKKDMSDQERKQLDNQYARNYSFWFDMKIILKTIPALMQKEDV